MFYLMTIIFQVEKQIQNIHISIDLGLTNTMSNRKIGVTSENTDYLCWADNFERKFFFLSFSLLN